ncbi:uncharacterized protein LOC131161000 [Malania oleifera]|uniref:uncharacterized protein LOC131161000 n=1 Tax=Malania oleifera TaxID=397392 RepID=UPI0025AEBE2C|nr:uncharacterized protein LOC131161000 [Malania oleifera]
MEGTLDAIMCRAFIVTFKGNARAWYQTLKPGSINSFSEMEQQFTSHFISSRRISKTMSHLMSLVQGERETLKKSIHRFVIATIEIRNLDHGVTLAALTTALQPDAFLYSLGKKPPADVGELMARAHKYINLQEVMDTRRDRAELKRKGARDISESSKAEKRQESSKPQSVSRGS